MDFLKLNSYRTELIKNKTFSEKRAKKIFLDNREPFQEQAVIGRFIVDFLLPERMLILELDGSSHNEKEDYDARRDKELESWGFDVLHIPNKLAKDVQNIVMEFRVYKNWDEKLSVALGKAGHYGRNY